MQTCLQAIVEQAVAKLATVGEAAASRKPAPEKWSAREILGHLIDSASVNWERILRVSLHDGLILHAYPQDDWVRLQAYQERPWAELLILWQALNRHIAHLVERLPEASLAHTFRVPHAHGATLRFLIEDYIAHLEHHLRQIEARVAQVQIRPATAADAETMAQMVRSAWAGKVAPDSSGHQESPEKVRADLERGYGWVAVEAGQVVGTVRLVRHPGLPEHRIWEVKKLGVLPEYRKQGVAHRLMDAVARQALEVRARELRLAVRHDQPKLLKWYSQFGFAYDPSLQYSSANPNTPPPFVMSKKLEVLS
ncbi:GNAT family N-acetyltransferase [uncultured Meiothermus sp.]|jgi:ribosomal protein S18 acetylase RimI-like enzyme|uniref:GNAT family N-acetyltransferase n=1 Tax=uncultured Meiothermus sp. TaxID=157471 RepID=UPI0026146395|nr:GNAT family N-acetyltransferase [uncultured Meiothermus sp.]